MSNATASQQDEASQSDLTRRIVLRDPEATPRVNAHRTAAYYLQLMEQVGIDAILEEYAGGVLPVEIAASRSWPIMVFTMWMEDKADPEMLARAKRMCAQSLAARGMNILTMPRRDASDASLMTAYSRQAQNAAAKLDPDSWGTAEGTPFGGGAVAFVLNINSDAPFNGTVVRPKDEAEEAEVVVDETPRVNFSIPTLAAPAVNVTDQFLVPDNE